MRFKSTTSNTTRCQQAITEAMQQCRAKTLALFEGMDAVTFRHQAHPEFSPVGWHLGHIAYTESLWILERIAGFSPLFPQYCKLFAADGLPKSERANLLSLPETLDFLDTVREKVLHYLEVADFPAQERLWRFLLQHESQHCETIAFVLELVNRQLPTFNSNSPRLPIFASPRPFNDDTIQIPAGEFEIGNNSLDALDNERPVHRLYLDTYYIDRYPVTCRQYRAFMAAGGYQNSQWWSASGWEWLQKEQVTQPLYWKNDPVEDNHPVCGVSWYEAEAYCNFVGKRLPTEAEWEKAVSWDSRTKRRRIYPWGDDLPTAQDCNHNHNVGKTTPVDAYPSGQSAYGLYDALGNVWEWTASWFDGYQGFQSYPYIGYSQVYFDQQHRVLRGGSWATRPWALRASFRNWYHPGTRQIFAGFRCTKD